MRVKYVVAASVAVLSMIVVLPQFSPALAALINCYTGSLSALFHLFEFVYLLIQIAVINPLYAAVYPDYGVFKNQIILITGASSGIDNDLILAARRVEKLTTVANKCLELGARSATVVKYDAANPLDARDLVAKTISSHPSIDMLVLNAGVSGAWSKFDDVKNTEDIHKVMDINYFGYVELLHESYKYIKAGEGKRIVVISSFYDSIISPFQGGYAGSKHALQGFFNTVRQEFLHDGVSVTVHSPGGVLTEVQGKFTDASGRSSSIELPSLFLASAEDCATSILYNAYHRVDQAYFPTYATFMNSIRRMFATKFDFLFHRLLNFYVELDIIKLTANN